MPAARSVSADPMVETSWADHIRLKFRFLKMRNIEGAAADACVGKTLNDQPCTVSELKSLKKAWDNDVLMCYGNGNGCLAVFLVEPKSAPKPQLFK